MKLLKYLKEIIKVMFSGWLSAKAEQKEQAEIKAEIKKLEKESGEIKNAEDKIYQECINGERGYTGNDDWDRLDVRRVQVSRRLGVLYARLKKDVHS